MSIAASKHLVVHPTENLKECWNLYAALSLIGKALAWKAGSNR